jgi:hypothetical protein
MGVTDLPGIGDPVILRDSAGLTYASRLEDIDGDVLSVARPADLRAALEYDMGLELDLLWTLSAGIGVVPTELTGTAIDQHIRLWQLTMTGDAHVEQRRDYVRVPVTGRVQLSAEPTGADDSPLDAEFVDLSEIAAQCSVPLAIDDPRIEVGRTVQCRFALGDDEFSVAAEIAIVRPGATAHESRIVIRFGSSQAVADALRKQVFRIQVQMRRERHS